MSKLVRRATKIPYAPTQDPLPVEEQALVDMTDPAVVMGMYVAGVPKSRIAEAAGVKRQVLDSDLRHCLGKDYPERVRWIRNRLRYDKMRRMRGIEARLYGRLEREVDKVKAADVDALARAAKNLESIQVSASGEGQKIEVSTANEQPLVDLKVLIQHILEAS